MKFDGLSDKFDRLLSEEAAVVIREEPEPEKRFGGTVIQFETAKGFSKMRVAQFKKIDREIRIWFLSDNDRLLFEHRINDDIEVVDWGFSVS